jgi:hypothetical protein
MTTEMSLSDVLSSKIYVKRDGGVNFQSPSTYITPFLDAINWDGNANSIRVSTMEEVVNANEEGGAMNIAYPRVLVEARTNHDITLPGSSSADFQSVIGLIYALDVKPVIKVYSGQNASACLNLTVFNAEGLHEQSLTGSFNSVFNHAREYVNKKEAEVAEFTEIYNDLANTTMSTEELNQEIGRILRYAPKTRIGTTPIVQAARRLDSKDNRYYVKPDEQCSKFNLYNAITQSLTDSKDFLDKPLKTVQLSKLFNIFKN